MRTASVPYFIGWCCLIAAIYLDGAALPLVIAGGALLGLGAGVMRALAVAEPAVGSLVNILSMGGMLVAAVTVLAAWRSKSLRLSITAVYRLLFPFLITSLLALPLLGLEYARWLAAALYAAYSAAIIATQSQLVREHYRLTAREAEVMELIARGHSVARIAESLVVSENTIRTHSKHLYTKLGIHKKQELVDLLEGFRGE